MMPVWTIVIGDQPIFAFSADSQIAAQRHLEEEGVKDDLSYYENDDGSPLWDGEAPLHLRPATPNEQQTWRRAQERPSGGRMTSGQEQEGRATYLVSIHDPADDDVLLM